MGLMYASPRHRAASALASLAIVLLLAFALIFGLRVGAIVRDTGSLVSVLLPASKPPPPPKPPKPEVRPSARPAAKGAPSPRNLRNQATPVVAPPVIPLIVPPPIVAATQAGTGQAASSGASDRAGPGQGAGGLGNGNGGGGNGGDGDGDGVVEGPRQIRGKLSFRDMPEEMLPPGSEARVGVRYTVEIDGRVSHCLADEPSGIPGLDVLACRLIEERFRFRPARGRDGRPMRATIVEAHSWFIREERPRG